MAEVIVNPGVCGFNTILKINSEDMQNADVEITTECPNVKSMEQELKELDGYVECFAKFGDSRIFEAARKHCRHAACPVPTAIIKGVEAACGLALPRDVEIKISQD